MAKSIKLSVDEWKAIRRRIKDDYHMQPSILMIKSVLLRELGFSVRLHTIWEMDQQKRPNLNEFIYLDFYDDQKETMFRLKYL